MSKTKNRRWNVTTEVLNRTIECSWNRLYGTCDQLNDSPFFAPCDNPIIKAGVSHIVIRQVGDEKNLHRFCSEKCRVEYLRGVLML